MPVYWSMLLMTLVVAVLSYSSKGTMIEDKGTIIYKTPYRYALFTMIYIVFFVGLRDRVLDTYAYIESFNNMPTDWKTMVDYVENLSTGKGFYLLEGVFKIFISKNHYVWLTFLALISCMCLLKILYRYSIDFPLTAYLFVANTSFAWLLNGTRQFLAVCILFAFSDWLMEGKKIRYILLTLMVTTIHTSAIFVIPICLFISSKKVFGKRMILFTLLTVIGTNYSDKALDIAGIFLDKDYSSSLANGAGSNIIRLFVALLPVVIVLLSYHAIKQEITPSICLAINMSIVGACFYFASSFTNAILVGRMPIYFTIYNLYLLPWLIKKSFTKESSKLVWWACVGFYGMYFYYQMMIAWHGLEYVSFLLNIGVTN